MIKKMLLGAALSFACLSAMPALAGPTVGSTDSGNCYPFVCNDSGTNVGQSIDFYQIYSASQFGAGLSINSVTFFDTLFPGAIVLNGNYDISFATTTSAVGSAYPVAPLANIASFFNGALSGAVGSAFTINGSAYSYNTADGNLVMHVLVTNQDNVPNGTQLNNGYMDADYTGTATTRAYLVTGLASSAGVGALVTQFNGGVPEPATWALMLVGFGGLGAMLRSRRHAAALTA